MELKTTLSHLSKVGVKTVLWLDSGKVTGCRERSYYYRPIAEVAQVSPCRREHPFAAAKTSISYTRNPQWQSGVLSTALSSPIFLIMLFSYLPIYYSVVVCFFLTQHKTYAGRYLWAYGEHISHIAELGTSVSILLWPVRSCRVRAYQRTRA